MGFVDQLKQIGKPLALPGDSRSLTIPGVVVCLGLEFASFPLTPTLSPRRGRPLGGCWKTLMVRLQSSLTCLSFRRRMTTKLDRTTKARANVSPSPGGEGWGEGEQDARSRGRLRLGLGARKLPEAPHSSETFIISNLRKALRLSDALGSFVAAVSCSPKN